jgi:bromodomain-containing factor 1
MSETVHSAKVSRERDIDSEDEPVAKRTKVQHAQDQVEVKTSPAQDRMDLDRKAGAGAPGGKGESKSLSDDSLNNKPITEWQAKQIRSVLAGVKKTKVGMGFRQPVRDLWPNLWSEYSARVSNPVDISTMEKRLRGDKPPYATMGEFKHDLDLMVENSIAFNGEIHDVTHQAKSCRESILSRMAGYRAAEPAKPEKKESAKPHTTRHVEPRAPAPSASTIGVARPIKPPAPSPAQKPIVDSPAFAIPASNNGVPLIRRDSTKPDSRAKRPVKPAHSKDLVYDTKRKKKLPLELRFCDEVLTEIRKTKNYEINAAFMQPVDPVALNIPSYHRIIKKPMDLGTMSSKLASGEYTNAKEFERDFDLIIKNCRAFNGEDHLIYHQALRLQDLYRAEMSRKDEWMVKHGPAVTSHAAGPHLRDDSDDEDADSEADPEIDEERKQSQHRLATIQKRLEEEQKKINQMVNSGTAEIAEVEIAQSLVAMLQKQMMQERAKMANLPVKKAAKPKPKPAKKAGGGGGIPSKKASVAGPSVGAGGAAKKSGIKKAAPKRKIGLAEKDVISTHLGDLEGPALERAIDLIKKDTDQSENDSGELELDIESLSEDALVRLYEIVVKTFPHFRIKEEKASVAVQPSSDPPASRSNKASSASKSKKNKPMSKSEQERRIQQLNELRAQAGRQGSGSQEPIESIEGNGNEPAAHLEHESEDEVSSEEE